MEISIYLFLGIMAGVGVVLPVVMKIFFSRTKACKIVSWCVLVWFVITILLLTLGKVSVGSTVKIEFDFGGKWCDKHIWWFDNWQWKDVIINLVMMTPLGVFVWRYDRSFWKNLLFAFLFGFVLGVIIETSQFILPIPRTVQVQDAVFNGISSVIGMLFIHVIWCVFGKVKDEKDD